MFQLNMTLFDLLTNIFFSKKVIIKNLIIIIIFNIFGLMYIFYADKRIDFKTIIFTDIPINASTSIYQNYDIRRLVKDGLVIKIDQDEFGFQIPFFIGLFGVHFSSILGLYLTPFCWVFCLFLRQFRSYIYLSIFGPSFDISRSIFGLLGLFSIFFCNCQFSLFHFLPTFDPIYVQSKCNLGPFQAHFRLYFQFWSTSVSNLLYAHF